MKTVVVVGGGRNVGKTTLATALGCCLSGSVVVKIGTHPPKEGKPPFLFPYGTRYEEIVNAVGECRYLVIESGGILDDPDCEPELVIFLPTPDPRLDKPGSVRRRARADLVRGESVSSNRARELAHRLGVADEVFSDVLKAAGVSTSP